MLVNGLSKPDGFTESIILIYTFFFLMYSEKVLNSCAEGGL